ncbi:MAG: metalloregulator ArsR/SmtB family transcription factor [Planctomycetota bacterium]|nr:metalloregulator ArsR/SmtB family transcription factor [Planctomycetota bacterium]
MSQLNVMELTAMEQPGQPNMQPNQSATETLAQVIAPSPSVLGELVGFFKLLADETRLQILHHLLQSEEAHVRALCERLNQSQPAVSHHLALLKSAGLIVCRRDGKHNYYRLGPEQFRKFLDLAFAGVPAGSFRQRIDAFLQERLKSVVPNDQGTLEC